MIILILLLYLHFATSPSLATRHHLHCPDTSDSSLPRHAINSTIFQPSPFIFTLTRSRGPKISVSFNPRKTPILPNIGHPSLSRSKPLYNTRTARHTSMTASATLESDGASPSNPSSSSSAQTPTHANSDGVEVEELPPSKLGTKEHWDMVYE